MCIDVQGYAKGRLNKAPCYLAKFGIYRIAYAIQPGRAQAEEIKTAYQRALRMVKGVKSARIARLMRESSAKRYGTSSRPRYVRRTPAKRKAERIEPSAES